MCGDIFPESLHRPLDIVRFIDAQGERHQGLTTQRATSHAAQGLETLVQAFDRLAVQHQHLEIGQTTRQRVGHTRRKQLP